MKANCTNIFLSAAACTLLVGGMATADQTQLQSSGVAGKPVTVPQPIGLPCGESAMTQNTDPNTVTPINMIQCAAAPATSDNGVGRSFPITSDTSVCGIQFGSESNTSDWPLTVNLLAGDITGPYANLELRGTTTIIVPGNPDPALHVAIFDTPVEFSAGENMVVELFMESRVAADGGDGGALWLGSNTAGESAPSYLRSPVGCGLPDFETIQNLGFPNVHVVMTVYMGAGASCLGDLNGDDVVNVSDLLDLLGAWGPCGDPGDCPADLNEDGIVDVADMLLLLGAWGDCPAPPDPTGACCFDDFTCQELTADDCATAGGNYNGNFTSCGSCPQPPDGETCGSAFPIAPGDNLSTNTTDNPIGDAPICGGQVPNQPTAWYTVTGADTSLTVATETDSSSAAAVYCGNCTTLICVAGASGNSSGSNPFDAEVTWCAGAGNEYYIAVWRTDGAGDISVSLTEGAACTPDVSCEPPAGDSCVGNCGGQAPGGCWCDEICCDNNDCCSDKFEACGGCQPPAPKVCEGGECPPGSSDENEACGDDANGGCNSDPTVFGSIALGETMCGNIWANGGTRDLDWFELVITEPTEVTINGDSEEAVNMFITNGLCPTTIISDVATGCEPTTTICLAPGTYHFVVGATGFEGFPCPGFNYSVTLTGVPVAECEGGDPNSCVGNCGAQAPGGCWCDEACCDNGDCCADKFDACGGCEPGGGGGGDSCVGNCGAQAPAGCWCDETCCTAGDCCADKFEACAGCQP